MHCPDCRKPLVRTRHPGDVQWACVDCRRRLVADATLEVLLTEAAAAAFVAVRLGTERLGPRPCPSCRHRMAVRVIDLPRARLAVDHCGRCRTTWFDRGEFEQLPQATTSDGAPSSDGSVIVRSTAARAERVLVRGDGKLAPADEEFAKPSALLTPIMMCAMFVSTFGLAYVARRRWRHPPEDRLSITTWSWPADRSWWVQFLDVPALLVHSGIVTSLLALAAFSFACLALERRLGVLRTLLLCVAANGFGRVLHLSAFGSDRPIPAGAGATITALVAALAVVAPWASLGNVADELGGYWRLLLDSMPRRYGREPWSLPPSSLPEPRTAPPPPLDAPRGLARVPLIALLPAWLALDLTLGRISVPLRSDLLFQPTSSMQHVGGLMVGLLFGGWWRGFTLRHPATLRRGADR
jgi:Zn-finger nucleic acid-binding protein/membrane associated rhomboid family serine protease